MLRAGLLKLGGSMLGQLLSADPGHRGPRLPCGQGHEAETAMNDTAAATGPFAKAAALLADLADVQLTVDGIQAAVRKYPWKASRRTRPKRNSATS